MARQARGEALDPEQVQVVHCYQRCVRHAFLCGADARSGKSYHHRRQWVRDRFEFLASVFGIDCLTYSVMENHLHVVLRSRPDVVASWSDDEVARRWLRLFPKRRKADGSPAEPSQSEIDQIINEAGRVTSLRRRLSDLSWWMKCSAEHIARRCNREEEVTGHFWEGRFRAQLLLDEAAVLACAAYVDLNPVRAAMAESPETSRYTGVKDRIDDFCNEERELGINAHVWERSSSQVQSGWLSPIEIHELDDPIGPSASDRNRRASDKGFLPFSLPTYLKLLDWTGRQLRDGKRGSIPHHLQPILDRLGLDASGWCDVMRRFGRQFKRAAGTVKHLQEEATRRGQCWLQSAGALG